MLDARAKEPTATLADRGIALSGTYIYLANDTNGLRIYQMVPQLRISLTATNTVLLSWPETPVAFRPQESIGLASPAWATLTNAPFKDGIWTQVTLPPPPSSRFYRLAQE